MLTNPLARRLEALRTTFQLQTQRRQDCDVADQHGTGSAGTPEAAELARLKATEPARRAAYAALLASARAEEPRAIDEWAAAHREALLQVIAECKQPYEKSEATRYLAELDELRAGTRDLVSIGPSGISAYTAGVLALPSPLLLTEESLRVVCGAPLIPREACPTCCAIPDQCDRFEKAGDVVCDTIPPAVAALVRFIEFGEQVKTEWVARCPSCMRLYLEVCEYEYLVFGSEDTHGLVRVAADGIWKHMSHSFFGTRGELHRIGGDLWRFVRR